MGYRDGRDLTGYHDQEWGTPTHDEAMMFEALVLTYFENGLSWATVFDKRDNLRTAFHGFNPAVMGAMTSDDVERLMADTSIIRNRRKIEATLHNASVLSKHSLSQLAWQHQGVERQADADGRAQLTDSAQIACEHRKHGEGEHQTRGRHHTTGASESVDETGMQPGVNLFFNSDDQQ